MFALMLRQTTQWLTKSTSISSSLTSQAASSLSTNPPTTGTDSFNSFSKNSMVGPDLNLQLVGILGQTQQFGANFIQQSKEISTILDDLKKRFEDKLLIASSHPSDVTFEFTSYIRALYMIFDEFNHDLKNFAETPLLNVKYYGTCSSLQSYQQIIQNLIKEATDKLQNALDAKLADLAKPELQLEKQLNIIDNLLAVFKDRFATQLANEEEIQGRKPGDLRGRDYDNYIKLLEKVLNSLQRLIESNQSDDSRLSLKLENEKLRLKGEFYKARTRFYQLKLDIILKQPVYSGTKFDNRLRKILMVLNIFKENYTQLIKECRGNKFTLDSILGRLIKENYENYLNMLKMISNKLTNDYDILQLDPQRYSIEIAKLKQIRLTFSDNYNQANYEYGQIFPESRRVFLNSNTDYRKAKNQMLKEFRHNIAGTLAFKEQVAKEVMKKGLKENTDLSSNEVTNIITASFMSYEIQARRLIDQNENEYYNSKTNDSKIALQELLTKIKESLNLLVAKVATTDINLAKLFNVNKGGHVGKIKDEL